jgi:3-dehydroquinate synthase
LSGVEQVFSVPFRFPVHFTRDAWNPSNRLVVDTIRRLESERRHRLLVVIDEPLARAQPELTSQIGTYVASYGESLELAGAPMLVTGGEAVKNDVTHTFAVLQRINDAGIDRQSFVVAIGGGAVLDMVSFAAAIAHRGVRVVRFPTTVLSQGDSGIAVKNGLNFFGKKNFIGTFVPPFAVINDIDSLRTLSHRDKISGVSEAVKVALLKDPAFYRFIESHAHRLAAGDLDSLGTVIERSAELHLAHICGNGDPFELGSARPLDFGHWAAHKLEAITNHRVRHGEAVAIGMALDLAYSEAMGYLDRTTLERVLQLLERIGFVLWDDSLRERDSDGGNALTRGLREFREHLGGELHITLLKEIGCGFEVTEMDEATVALCIQTLARRQSRRGMAVRAAKSPY